MRKRFDLYGFRSLPLIEAARLIEATLGLLIEPRESSFYGGDYYLGTGDSVDEVIVQSNYEDEDGLAEPDFPEQHVLVYVAEPSRETTEKLQSISTLTLLRTEFV